MIDWLIAIALVTAVFLSGFFAGCLICTRDEIRELYREWKNK